MTIVPCRRGCCQKQRKCRTGLCCQWTCQGSWWTRCPLQTSWGRDLFGTTWFGLASLWPRQSSWCPRLSQLEGGGAEREKVMSVFIWSHESDNISVTSMYAIYMFSYIYHGHFHQRNDCFYSNTRCYNHNPFTPQTDHCLNNIPREKNMKLQRAVFKQFVLLCSVYYRESSYQHH